MVVCFLPLPAGIILMKIKRFLFAALLAAFGSIISAQAADLTPSTVQDFRGGLVTNDDASRICDGCSPDLQNVDFFNGFLEKRRGSITQNVSAIGTSQPIRFLHEFIDTSNNVWMLAISSNSLYKSSNAGATWSLVTSTCGITSSSIFSAANAFSKAWLLDGSTNAITFDGTNVAIATYVPKGNAIAFAFGRLFVTNVSGARSTLYACRNGDPLDWTTDSLNDTGDSQTILIRQNDGYPCRALYLYRDELLIFKDRSIDAAIVGSDGNTIIIAQKSSTKGTQHPKSVQSDNKRVIFLADDNYYGYNGAAIEPLSKGIMPTVSTIRQLVSGAVSWTQTDGADWNAGTFSSTNSAISSTAFVGSLYFSTKTIDDFSDGDITSNPAWVSSITITGTSVSTINYNSGLRQYGVVSTTFEAVALISTVTFSTNYSTGIWTVTYTNILTSPGTTIPEFIIELHSVTNSTSVITAYIDSSEAHLYKDRINTSGANLLYSNNYPFNGTVSISIMRQSDDVWTLTVGTVSANVTFASVDHRTFNKLDFASSLNWSSGGSPDANSIDTTLKKVYFSPRSDRWESQTYNVGSNILSWGPVTINDEGTAATYELYVDSDNTKTSSNPATFTSSQTITNGFTPTVLTGAFVSFASTFSRTTANQNHRLDDFTISWYEANVTPQVVSTIYQNDYICSVAVDSITVNDTMLVLDRNGSWTTYKGMTASSLVLYRNQPYFGSASNGYVGRFQVDGVYSDSGTAITAYWKSKEFDFGYPTADKTMQRYRITAQRTVSSDAVFSYGVNRGNQTDVTLDLDLFSGLFHQTIKPSSLTYQRGINHSFKISDSDAGQYFRVLSVTLEPRLETQD